MKNGIKTIAAGASALTAAAAAVTGVVLYNDANKAHVEQETLTELSTVQSETICLRGKLPFFSGTQATCYSRDEFNALYDSDVLNYQGDPVAVRLTHPSDSRVPENDCRTCRDYLDLSWENWFPMTGRAQRRNAFFARACGTLEALSKAGIAQQSYFDAGALQAEDIQTMLGTDAFKFGEAPVSIDEEPVLTRLANDDWQYQSGELVLTLRELATANFDQDDSAEILVFVQIGPVDGTARINEVGFINKDSADATASYSALR